MIKELTIYTVICDGCGKDAFDWCEYSGWNDESTAEFFACDDSDFQEIDNKHYCTDCYEYDERDNLIIKINK